MSEQCATEESLKWQLDAIRTQHGDTFDAVVTVLNMHQQRSGNITSKIQYYDTFDQYDRGGFRILIPAGRANWYSYISNDYRNNQRAAIITNVDSVSANNPLPYCITSITEVIETPWPGDTDRSHHFVRHYGGSIQTKTVTQLKACAAARGLTGYSRLAKADLVKLLAKKNKAKSR